MNKTRVRLAALLLAVSFALSGCSLVKNIGGSSGAGTKTITRPAVESAELQFTHPAAGEPVAVFDTTAVGAARLAALGHGDFPDPYGVAGGQMKKCYEPHMSEDQRQHLLSQWERAVQRAMHWAQ